MTSTFSLNSSKNEIKICYWNIHGLKSEIIDDKLLDPEFLKILQNSDLVALSELHTERKDLFIPGYRILKQKIRKKEHKGPKIAGGIAVFIKENLFNLAHVVPNTNENSIWIKIKSKIAKGNDLFIGSYYVSPENSKCKHDLFAILQEAGSFKDKGDIIIQGDFNARTGQKKDFIPQDPFLEDLFEHQFVKCKNLPPRNSEDLGSNTRGDELLDFCKTNEFAIVNGRKIGDLFGKRTSHQYNGSSAVDFLLTPVNVFEKISFFEVGKFLPWLSDHTPIFSNFSLDFDTTPPEPPITLHKREHGYIWNDEYEEQFKAFLVNEREKLENSNQSTKENSDANELANTIKSAILAASKNCNLKKRKQKKIVKTKPWFDKECQELKENITETGKKLRSCQENTDLRKNLFELKKTLKKTVRKKKRLHKKMILNEMGQCGNMDQKKYWKLLSQLEQKDTNTTEYVSPRNLLDHYKKLLNSNRPLDLPADSPKTGKLDHPITLAELDEAKNVLKKGKANGIDTISNEMISCFLEVFPHIILTLFNCILDNNLTIEDWTIGIITAIYKNKGSRSDPENYRGISLLSCLSKFFTAVLHNRLLKYTTENKILSQAHLGFVEGNRTSDAHLITHNLIRKQCHNNGRWLYSCFIDFSKAFDTIPRDKLLEKLLDFGIDGKFFNMIKNIYTHDKICIKYGESITDAIDVNMGVKQGCILSPLLFNIFLSDLPQLFDKDIKSTNPILDHPSSLFWADDIVLFSETEEGMHRMLKTLEKYCEKNELTLNTDKTKCMIFNKGGRLIRTPFYYNNVKLENVNKFKYLGFLLTPSGEIMSGLKDLRDRALKGYYKLKTAMGESFRLHLNVTIHLFDTLIKPILMYMSDFWGGLKSPDERKHPIEKFHMMACKQMLGVQKQTSNTGVLLELGRIPLQNFAIKSAIKNWERIKTGNINDNLKHSHLNAELEDLPWATHTRSIIRLHNLENLHQTQSKSRKHPFLHKIVHTKQCELFHQNAFLAINSPDSKLRTYGLFKTEIGRETYLDQIKNTGIRQSLTKFRLSNSLLNIEKLRHTTPKTPKERRFCPFCPESVEDEAHFLITCPVYHTPRESMLEVFLNENPLFYQKTPKQKFLELMTPENAQFAAKTVHNLFEIRNFLINKPKRPA